MQIDLNGKVAIVTGSARGIGEAIAEALVQCGAAVVISDVLIEQGRETAARLGKSATFIPCDVSDNAAVCALVDAAVKAHGRLDIMVNNAGINAGMEHRVTVDQYPVELWHRILNVNLNGTFYGCRAASAQMMKQKSGSIINISSIAGVVALRLQIGFDASKAAIIKMTEAMAAELGPHGIRTNTVSPGSTMAPGNRKAYESKEGLYRTDWISRFVPMQRPADTTEVAGAVAFLASDLASYVNGLNLVVDGGWVCVNRDF